jgi:hypothetical protein
MAGTVVELRWLEPDMIEWRRVDTIPAASNREKADWAGFASLPVFFVASWRPAQPKPSLHAESSSGRSEADAVVRPLGIHRGGRIMPIMPVFLDFPFVAVDSPFGI